MSQELFLFESKQKIVQIYVNVDTPNLGFPYFNFLGGYQ